MWSVSISASSVAGRRVTLPRLRMVSWCPTATARSAGALGPADPVGLLAQPSAEQWRPRDDAQTLLLHRGNDFQFNGAGEQVVDGLLTDQVGVAAHGDRAMCEPARGGGPIQDLAVLDGHVDGLPDGCAYLRGWHLGIGNIVILKSANAHRMRSSNRCRGCVGVSQGRRCE